MLFTPAVKRQSRPRVGIAHMHSTGGTLGALRLAGGLAHGKWEEVFVLDTNRDRALAYAPQEKTKELSEFGVGRFRHVGLNPPYSPERYAHLIEAAAREGAKVLVIDDESKEWNGAIDTVREANKGGGWKEIEVLHRIFKKAKADFPGALVSTFALRVRRVAEEEEGQDGLKKAKSARIAADMIAQPGTERDYPFFFEMGVGYQASFLARIGDLWMGVSECELTQQLGEEIAIYCEEGAPELPEDEPIKRAVIVMGEEFHMGPQETLAKLKLAGITSLAESKLGVYPGILAQAE
jgi:hypothetical protein